MSEPALPRTFDPEYGTAVRRILPAIVVLMTSCGLAFLIYREILGVSGITRARR